MSLSKHRSDGWHHWRQGKRGYANRPPTTTYRSSIGQNTYFCRNGDIEIVTRSDGPLLRESRRVLAYADHKADTFRIMREAQEAEYTKVKDCLRL